MLFAFLFVLFSLVTSSVVCHFGGQGVWPLSNIVGVTDIDPFLLNLFQGNYRSIPAGLIARAAWIAAAGNNVLKWVYSGAFGGKKIARHTLLGFGSIMILSAVLIGMIR